MRMTMCMQTTKCVLNFWIYPRLVAIVILLGAHGYHARKVMIGGNPKPVLPNGFGQRVRQPKPLQRENGPLFRLNPKCVGVIARVGHRENTISISAHQQIEIDRQPVVLPDNSFCYHELRGRTQSLIRVIYTPAATGQHFTRIRAQQVPNI